MYMKTRVLLVDIEPRDGEKLRRQLERQDYEVRWAADGLDMLQNLDFQQTDVLLIDLYVPPAESLDILSRIAEVNPLLKVVGLTERTDLRAAVFGSGLSAVAEKPIDEVGLLLVMDELLKRVPRECGVFRLVPRKTISPQGVPRRQPAEPNISPAVYSGGWGINE